MIVEVEGAGAVGNVTYNVGFDTMQAPEDTLTVSLWVQNADTAGVVKCRIKVDGKTVQEAKSNGPYGVCRVETGSLDQ
ncbi:hypothetical protein AB0O28_37230 [Microbispora sp. NPDC088329]|uniref:hypothetical protein n=1 Tax=Microbispora sp. NPDC088329 TaxID=3154869 RepID=UPI00342657A0